MYSELLALVSSLWILYNLYLIKVKGVVHISEPNKGWLMCEIIIVTTAIILIPIEMYLRRRK